MGDQDDGNNPKWCVELTKAKRSIPVQMIEYQGADHGFVLNQPSKVGVHGWHLTYNPVAEQDMMQTVIAAIKMKKFAKGVESR
jgi:dienelactone hydrolase